MNMHILESLQFWPAKNHPYKNFSFVKEASSKKEYKKLLKNIKKFKINFSKKKYFHITI